MDRRPGVRTLVAVDGPTGAESVLGTATYLPTLPGAGSPIANAGFVVEPTAAGRGIGTALVLAVLDGARADGYRAMQLNAVVETNDRAVRLWRSLGFEIIGTVPAAFDHPTLGTVGLHIMHRAL